MLSRVIFLLGYLILSDLMLSYLSIYLSTYHLWNPLHWVFRATDTTGNRHNWGTPPCGTSLVAKLQVGWCPAPFCFQRPPSNWPYFVGIFPCIGLIYRPCMESVPPMSRILKFPLINGRLKLKKQCHHGEGVSRCDVATQNETPALRWVRLLGKVQLEELSFEELRGTFEQIVSRGDAVVLFPHIPNCQRCLQDGKFDLLRIIWGVEWGQVSVFWGHSFWTNPMLELNGCMSPHGVQWQYWTER